MTETTKPRTKRAVKKKAARVAAAPKKTGRPTAYQPAYAEQAYRLCLLGATDAQLAAFFGVAESTLHEWKLKHPAFPESIMRGKVSADAEIAEALFHRAKGYSHRAVKIFMPGGVGSAPVYADYLEHYPPDTQAASLWLRNRQPAKWRDKMDLEHTGKNGGPIEQITRAMTPEEASRIYTETMRPPS